MRVGNPMIISANVSGMWVCFVLFLDLVSALHTNVAHLDVFWSRLNHVSESIV